MPSARMKRSILPSLSQVMSDSTARRVGRSFSICKRHQRVQLVDRPDIRQRLEQREVAVIDVGELVQLVLDIAAAVVAAARWP